MYLACVCVLAQEISIEYHHNTVRLCFMRFQWHLNGCDGSYRFQAIWDTIISSSSMQQQQHHHRCCCCCWWAVTASVTGPLTQRLGIFGCLQNDRRRCNVMRYNFDGRASARPCNETVHGDRRRRLRLRFHHFVQISKYPSESSLLYSRLLWGVVVRECASISVVVVSVILSGGRDSFHSRIGRKI